MKKVLGGVTLAAIIAAVGLAGGYWHFSDLLPLRERTATGETGPAGEQGAPPPSQDAASRDTAMTTSNSDDARADSAVVPDPALADPSPSDLAASDPSPSDPTGSSRSASAPQAGPADEAAEPSVDLLRVEPDGSAIIAGRAAPMSEIVVRNGDEIVARDRAGASGDFAATLDRPLAVGDHELSVEATGPDGTPLTARDVAIVSVPPRGREYELLVALGAPDGPTRLLAVPSAAPGAATPDPAAPSGEPEPPVAAAPEMASSPSDTASLSAPLATPSAPEPSPTPVPTVSAETGLSVAAVEIEGDRLYIAGTARPGASVRIYLDDALIGQAEGRDGGQFIAEARTSVPVGSHVVRVDQISPDGSVVARVAVPFDRPEGNRMAALAPRAGAPTPSSDPASARTEDPAPVPQPGTGEPQPRAGLSRDPAMDGDDAPDTSAGRPAADVAPNIAATAPVTADTPPSDAPDPPAVQYPLRPTDQPDGASVAPPVTQAALEPVDGRVIIRRGDTLWRISRETYGRGSRYTVIYLANGDQIRDPDRIYPGQVFRLPDEEAETRVQ